MLYSNSKKTRNHAYPDLNTEIKMYQNITILHKYGHLICRVKDKIIKDFKKSIVFVVLVVFNLGSVVPVSAASCHSLTDCVQDECCPPSLFLSFSALHKFFFWSTCLAAGWILFHYSPVILLTLTMLFLKLTFFFFFNERNHFKCCC